DRSPAVGPGPSQFDSRHPPQQSAGRGRCRITRSTQEERPRDHPPLRKAVHGEGLAGPLVLAKKCIKRPCAGSNKIEGEHRPYKGNDMATSQMSEIIQHLRRTVLLREGAGLADGPLLKEYLSHRDEAALAALARRHGRVVWAAF